MIKGAELLQTRTRFCYITVAFFLCYALLQLGIHWNLLADSSGPQRTAALSLVTPWTPISIYAIAGVCLLISRQFLWIFPAGFSVSLPFIYQLWVALILPLYYPVIPVSYLGTALNVFLLTLLPMATRLEVLHAKWEAVNGITKETRQGT